jgi:hypothetical protein
MKYLLFLFIFLNGCIAIVNSDETIIKKSHLDLIEENSRRLISSEERFIMEKIEWNKKDLISYSLSKDTNTQFLELIGTYKELEGKDLYLFAREGRIITDINNKLLKELEKLKDKKEK